MISNVTIPARYCTCDVCDYDWYSIAGRIPTHCQNRECRSREWNGKKGRKPPAPKATLVMPNPVKIRGGEDDEGF